MRCRLAIKAGTTLTSRCHLVAGHVGSHESRGLIEFPYQRWEWLPGDRREFETDRDDLYAWETPFALPVEQPDGSLAWVDADGRPTEAPR